jgi:hypothetical protein
LLSSKFTCLLKRKLKKDRSVKISVFAALLCSFLFAIPALAETADHQGPVRDKDRILGGIGGTGSVGSQKNAGSDKGSDGSEQHGAGAGVAGGGGAPVAGGGGENGVAARLADVVGDIFDSSGGPNSNRGNSDVRGAPSPIAGAGLPFLGIGYGVYWLIRRRRKAGCRPECGWNSVWRILR